MLEDISASRIPTLVYLAPIRSSSLADPAVDVALAGIEEQLSIYRDRVDPETVEFSPISLSRELPELGFRDLIHMWSPSADIVSEVIVERACAQLTNIDLDPKCGPVPNEGES